MQAVYDRVGRLIPGWLSMVLALVLVACATSPTEQLVKAEKLLSRLEAKGANEYLVYEMAEVRRQVERAKKLIRNNRFESANETLFLVCQKLDSCGVALAKLQRLAEQKSHEQVEYLTSWLASLSEVVDNLPRQTYVDQNRHMIHANRLKKYQTSLDQLKELVENDKYTQAIDQAAILEHKIEKTFIDLKDVRRVASKQAKKNERNNKTVYTDVLMSATR